MILAPHEDLLVGKWAVVDGRMVADAVSDRIKMLTKSYLDEIARDASGWNVLYRNPNDGKLWELDYPQSELTGGGPPRLRLISIEEVRQKYGISV